MEHNRLIMRLFDCRTIEECIITVSLTPIKYENISDIFYFELRFSLVDGQMNAN